MNSDKVEDWIQAFDNLSDIHLHLVEAFREQGEELKAYKETQEELVAEIEYLSDLPAQQLQEYNTVLHRIIAARCQACDWAGPPMVQDRQSSWQQAWADAMVEHPEHDDFVINWVGNRAIHQHIVDVATGDYV